MTEHLEPAPQAAVRTLASKLRDKLAPLSRERLGRLIELMDGSDRINYAEAYKALFPRSGQSRTEKTKADKAFKKFRDTVETIAEEHGLILALRVDQNRSADPTQRHFWFAVADDVADRLAGYNRGAIQTLNEVDHPQEQALTVRDTQLSYLLVYAESERDKAHQLHDELAVNFKTLGCKWSPLDYHHILPGEDREQTRRDYLRQAGFILFLVSKALIADLKDNRDLRPDRPLIPLKLKDFRDEDLAGTVLAGKTPAADTQSKAWDQRSGQGKDAWVDQVARAIPETLQRDLSRNAGIFAGLKAGGRRAEDCEPEHFVDSYLTGQTQQEGQKALPFLLEWLRDPEGRVLCALFGELGMGKTTLAQRLTQELMTLCTPGSGYPFPVYLDLRHVNAMDWDWSRGAPGLDLILEHILQSAFNLDLDSPRPTVDDVKRLAQKQGGLVIFDGLDEVMNRLTPDQWQAFIQRLWGILPPAVWKRPNEAGQRPKGCGRLLMTCRSHFFQTLQDQLSALSGRQREAVTDKDYLWVTLLPFKAEQVETYFRQVFAADPEQARRVIAMLDDVHDLRELSSRPYNLRLIQDQVEHLEAIQRQGKPIGIADLYEGMVGQWTRRDDPKHRLKREHKLLLMERLALRLWKLGDRSLAYTDLENWLLDELAADPRWRLNYQAYLEREQGIDILQEDLRNASFIVREGDDRFRFAHTSIMEFFLARALHRALVEDRPEHWVLPRPSPETLDFLGGLIAGRDTDKCLGGLARLRARYHEDASELALAYALRAHERHYPGARFDGFQLQGARLREQRFEAREGETQSWRGADLSGARLDGSRFARIDLTGARLDRADLARCLFDGCDLTGVSGQATDLTGTRFHQCPAPAADFTKARLYRTQWLGDPTPPPPAGLSAPPPALFRAGNAPLPASALPVSTTGHWDAVTALAVDPQGRWLCSGSDDRTLRLWDPDSGACLRTLEGHSGSVTALAVDPQGRWLCSGSDDRTLRLWDPDSGACLRTLEGHSGPVRALAVDPQGRWLCSGSDDRTLRLWDPDSGACLRTLEGHSGPVSALAVDPQGRWLCSGSDDRTLRLWDPDSGACLRTLEGHSGPVTALAVDPQGRWLCSGSDDRTLRLWDPDSGACLRTLEGHSGPVTALAVDPQGRWLCSGSDDRTLRLWDPDSGACLRTLEGHSGPVTALAVDPQGRWLCSGSADRTLRLWDPDSGACLRTLEGHSGPVWALAVDPQGRWLCSGSADRTLRLWDPDSGACLRTLEGHSGIGVGPGRRSPGAMALLGLRRSHPAPLGPRLRGLPAHPGGPFGTG